MRKSGGGTTGCFCGSRPNLDALLRPSTANYTYSKCVLKVLPIQSCNRSLLHQQQRPANIVLCFITAKACAVQVLLVQQRIFIVHMPLRVSTGRDQAHSLSSYSCSCTSVVPHLHWLHHASTAAYHSSCCAAVSTNANVGVKITSATLAQQQGTQAL